MLEINKIYCMDNVEGMKLLEEESVDLTVTSPPYDKIRKYNGYTWDFEDVVNQLYRITKNGGIVVWVIGDKIISGNRTLTSFKHALFFQEVGFRVHDVMIYKKKNTPFMRSNAYTSCHEFMFVFSKGKPKTFNPILENTVRQGLEMLPFNKGEDGINRKILKELKSRKVKTNIWEYAVGLNGTTKDRDSFKHPAIFPEKLAEDHILSWSNANDLILDPFMGSGTTAKMAILNNRNFIGFEISQEYCDIANGRIKNL